MISSLTHFDKTKANRIAAFKPTLNITWHLTIGHIHGNILLWKKNTNQWQISSRNYRYSNFICRPTVGTTAGRKSKTGFDWSWIQPIRRYKGKLPEHAFMSGII